MPSHNVFNVNQPAFDDIGHGTHVSGIVAATSNNGIGVASLAGWHPNIKILPIKVFEAGDDARLTNTQEGLLWAAEYGADIINNSWGNRIPYAPGHPYIVII